VALVNGTLIDGTGVDPVSDAAVMIQRKRIVALGPRPMEDPAWLDRQLPEFAKAPVDIEALFAKQRAAYTAAWERFCWAFWVYLLVLSCSVSQVSS